MTTRRADEAERAEQSIRDVFEEMIVEPLQTHQIRTVKELARQDAIDQMAVVVGDGKLQIESLLSMAQALRTPAGKVYQELMGAEPEGDQEGQPTIRQLLQEDIQEQITGLERQTKQAHQRVHNRMGHADARAGEQHIELVGLLRDSAGRQEQLLDSAKRHAKGIETLGERQQAELAALKSHDQTLEKQVTQLQLRVDDLAEQASLSARKERLLVYVTGSLLALAVSAIGLDVALVVRLFGS